jgi:hypothetical protein
VAVALVSLLFQVVSGVALLSSLDVRPCDMLVFFGAVIAVTFAFAFIYRAQFRMRPAL